MQRENVDGSAVRRLIAGDGESSARIQDRTAQDLAHVLSTAAGPLSGDELHGRQEALAAFRAARDEPAGEVPETTEGSVLRRGIRRLGAVRSIVLALIVAALLGGGVAVAGGGIPLPSSGSDAVPDGEPPSSPARPGTDKRTGAPGGAGSTVSPTPPASVGGSPAPRSRTARTIGLCRAYLRQSAHGPKATPDAPAFEALIAAAGGPERVDDYCRTVRHGHVEPTRKGAELSDEAESEPRRPGKPKALSR